jgi:hypothetical protein
MGFFDSLLIWIPIIIAAGIVIYVFVRRISARRDSKLDKDEDFDTTGGHLASKG